MSVLHKKQDKDIKIEEEGWCYSKKNISDPQQTNDNSNNFMEQIGDYLQIVESPYSPDKEALLKNTPFKFVKLQRLPILLNQQQIWEMPHDGDLILYITFNGYQICKSERTIVQCILADEMPEIESSFNRDCYVGGFQQRVYLEFDQIILVPFNRTQEFKQEQKQQILNLLCNFIRQLHQIVLILPNTIQLQTIVEISDIILNIKINTNYSCVSYKDLVLNCYRFYNNYLITFGGGNQKEIQQFLVEKVGFNCEKLVIDKLISLLFKKLTISCLKLNSNSKSASVPTISYGLSFGTDKMILAVGESNSFKLELDRDSYFNN